MATVTYKCPNCGGGLVFDPKTQKFTCEFCLSSFTQDELDKLTPAEASDQKAETGQGETFDQNMPGSGEQEGETGSYNGGDEPQTGRGGVETGRNETSERGAPGSAVLYTCPSCGAEIITDETTAATFCYYCHNPVVLEGKVSGRYLPDKIIPFQYDKKEATQRFLSYVKSKRFVPKAFFNEEQIEKLSGIYFPYWIYDCEVESNEQARGQKIRTWIAGDTQYTETSIYRLERDGTVHVQNITRNALKESDRRLIDAVRPYRLDAAQPFNMGFLQGFAAQRRDVETSDVAAELEQDARKYAKHAVRDSMRGYTAVQTISEDYRPTDEKWQYVLLPVWVLTYGSLNGKRYFYAMNGQTGETRGVLPLDYARLAVWSAGLGVILMAICLLVSYFIF